MDNFFAVIGAMCIAALLVSLAAGAVALGAEVVIKLYDRWRQDIICCRDAELAHILESGAHWFSHDPDTENLLRFLGKTIRGGYSVYAGHWRDEWERLRQEQKLKAPTH